MKHVEGYYEPIDKLSNEIAKNAEMTRDEMAFLCGLIKESKPSKIVEVGVAAGSTTAVIINCLELLDMKTALFSVDLNEKLYYQEEKLTGHIANEYISNKVLNTDFSLLVGSYLPEQLERIGNGIDLVILDTVHHLPGEILDFLAILPFLSDHAIVVLHDISLEHLNPKNDRYAYATQVLFQTVTASKFLNNEKEYPNIGAFSVDESTRENVFDVFSALTLSWHYFLDERELSIYQRVYRKYYDKDLYRIFDQAIELNRLSLFRLDYYTTQYINVLVNSLFNSFQHVLLYGAGLRSRCLQKYLNEIEGVKDKIEVVVSDKTEAKRKGCLAWDNINYTKTEALIILAADSDTVRGMLKESDRVWLDIPSSVWNDLVTVYK